ncbi:MAG TPA: molybdopterin dinucleotide binding domain-containing protein [Candidatus Krumholzibacteriaceae bacterium]|jgi:formylmethanofuran dehydrogenase subunit D|nr:molybdopterin dinucleotide binding domain-containing protein [Candidatus Krumholzibacteriaceae bacterium]
MAKIKVTLISGRTISQGTSKEHGKTSQEYYENVATCEIDPEDLKTLGIKGGENVKVSTEHGTVTVKAIESKRGPHPKIIYMPYGPWVNTIVNPATHGTGMPSYKGIPAEIEPATSTERVLSLQELLEQTFRKQPPNAHN